MYMNAYMEDYESEHNSLVSLTSKQEKVGKDKGIPFLSLLSFQHIPRRSIIDFDGYNERKDSLSVLVSVGCLFKAGYTY